MSSGFFEPSGQGLAQVADLGVALVLASAIGLEREARQRSAGLRTYTLVGFGSALVMLVSKYGFGEVTELVSDLGELSGVLTVGAGEIEPD